MPCLVPALVTTVEGGLKRPRARVARLRESAEFAQDSIGGWTIKKPKEPFTLAVVC
jgi:hypothetical protein